MSSRGATLIQAEIDYHFQLYHATFKLQNAGLYSALVTLRQRGGLRATYYETTNFQAPFADNDFYGHEPSFYTQIDAQVNFEQLEKAFVLKSGRNFPAQYFSIKWEGFLLFKYTETYRIYVEAFKSSEFSVYLNGSLILENKFNTSNENYLP